MSCLHTYVVSLIHLSFSMFGYVLSNPHDLDFVKLLGWAVRLETNRCCYQVSNIREDAHCSEKLLTNYVSSSVSLYVRPPYGMSQ